MKLKETTILLILVILGSAIGLGSNFLVDTLRQKNNLPTDDNKFEIIFAADFQNQEPGIFDYRDIKEEFGSKGLYFGRDLAGIGFYRKWHPEMEDDQNIFIEEEGKNKFTRNWFKAGHYGVIDTDWAIGSGHMYQPRIPGKHEEIWISHNIRWPDDRDWALSGNMGVAVRGGSSPYGCNPYS